MRKNTDLHLKTRTVTVKNVSGSFLRYRARCKKKVFCEDTGIDFFSELFVSFLRGVIERGVHCQIVSFYEGFLTYFPLKKGESTDSFANCITNVISKGVLHYINLLVGKGSDGSPKNKCKGGGVGAPADT